MLKSISISLFLVLSLPILIFGQVDADFAFFLPTEDKVENAAIQKNIVKKDKNALDVTTGLTFHVYKNYISSQDGNHCNFVPSCSRYCAHAIKKYGLIKGTIFSLDRLSRCNGLTPSKYEIDFKNRKLIDEVK